MPIILKWNPGNPTNISLLKIQEIKPCVCWGGQQRGRSKIKKPLQSTKSLSKQFSDFHILILKLQVWGATATFPEAEQVIILVFLGTALLDQHDNASIIVIISLLNTIILFFLKWSPSWYCSTWKKASVKNWGCSVLACHFPKG